MKLTLDDYEERAEDFYDNYLSEEEREDLYPGLDRDEALQVIIDEMCGGNDPL